MLQGVERQSLHSLPWVLALRVQGSSVEEQSSHAQTHTNTHTRVLWTTGLNSPSLPCLSSSCWSHSFFHTSLLPASHMSCLCTLRQSVCTSRPEQAPTAPRTVFIPDEVLLCLSPSLCRIHRRVGKWHPSILCLTTPFPYLESARVLLDLVCRMFGYGRWNIYIYNFETKSVCFSFTQPLQWVRNEWSYSKIELKSVTFQTLSMLLSVKAKPLWCHHNTHQWLRRAAQMVQKRSSINNVVLWSIRNQDARRPSTSTQTFLCSRRGVLSMKKMK